MDWIKKNLVLVVVGVVALGVLGFAGYFLWTKMQLSAQVTTELEEQDAKLQSLARTKPHPGKGKVDNIALAKEQDQKLQEYASRARQMFVPVPYPTNLDSGSFGLLLADTVDSLQRRAARSGTKIPDGYAFTFEAQKKALTYEASSLVPLVRALTEVKAITETLLDAKILEIDRIRRVSVASQDTPALGLMGGTSDYWTRKPATNELAVTIPYEFTFRCFSSELQSVMTGLARSPHSFLLKNLVVDTGETNNVDMFDPNAGGAGGEGNMPAMNPQMMMMMRYGLRGGMRGMPAMPPPDAATQAAQADAAKIVSEKPFRVTAWIDVVRLRDPNEAAAKGPGRARRATGDTGGEPAGGADAAADAGTAN
jgi:hypothetical protein